MVSWIFERELERTDTVCSCEPYAGNGLWGNGQLSVQAVRFQGSGLAVKQTTDDEPLNDLLVYGFRVDGLQARLLFQAKRALSVGAAADCDSAI